VAQIGTGGGLQRGEVSWGKGGKRARREERKRRGLKSKPGYVGHRARGYEKKEPVRALCEKGGEGELSFTLRLGNRSEGGR